MPRGLVCLSAGSVDAHGLEQTGAGMRMRTVCGVLRAVPWKVGQFSQFKSNDTLELFPSHLSYGGSARAAQLHRSLTETLGILHMGQSYNFALSYSLT